VTPYAWVVLAMLCFVYVFNFMDRQLMSVLTTYIKEDLKLTDTQVGLMTGLLFALFYTLLGVAAGWLADRSVRTWILGAGCFIWSLFTLLCGKAPNFGIMAIARMGVGVGEAAGAPPSYSIVSDYFPPEKRGLALALFSLGVPFGMALGAWMGPEIAERWSWRHAFIGIGLAGMVASVLLVIVVREPKKGAMDVKLDVHMEEAPTQALDRQPFTKSMNEFFGRPMLLAAAFSCAMAAFVGYAILNWTVPFLQRELGAAEYSKVKLAYPLMLAISMGLGTWWSGGIVDWLAKKSKINYALLPAAALALAIPFFIGFIEADTMFMKLAFLSVPTFLNIFYLAPALAVVQNSTKASQRTISGAMLLLVLNLIGLGGGPTLIGILSDHFNEANLAAASLSIEACAATPKPDGCAQASAEGLHSALYYLTPFYVLAVIALLTWAFFIRSELKNGAPSVERMERNAKVFKLLVGFGGIAVVILMEALLFGEPVTRDIKAIGDALGGALSSTDATLAKQTLNGLVRDLLMALMAIVAIMGLGDVFKKKAA
jgi:MFS family permease